MSDVQFNRVPVTGRPEEKREAFSLPPWPLPIPPLVVENLEIRRLQLGEQVLGEKASFHLKGAVHRAGPDGQIKGGLAFLQTDKPGTQVEMHFFLSGQDPELFLEARVEEPENGLLHVLSGLKDTGHLEATLEGQGPLSWWQGRLLAGAEKVGKIETDLKLIMQRALTLKMDGRITLHDSMVLSVLSPWLDGQGAGLMVDATYGLEDKIKADNIELKTGQLYFQARGSLDLPARTL